MRSPMSLGPLAFHWLTLLQDLVGRAQLPVLALQLLDASLLFAARPAAFARVTRRLNAPAAQGVMGAAELRRDRAVGGVLRIRTVPPDRSIRCADQLELAGVISPLLAVQPNTALAKLGRVLRGLLLRFHKGHPLRVLPSRKPGAFQTAFKGGSAGRNQRSGAGVR
jgi:hypothetical protein